MTTALNLVERTRRHLLSGDREERNTLSAAYSSGGTSLAFTYALGGIRAGSYLAIDNELFYVYAVDPDAKSATVAGAQEGSTAAAHASGADVYVNPPFSTWNIFRALNDDLNDLSSPEHGLYKINTVNLTYSAGQEGYNLTSAAAVLDILEVRYQTSGSEASWPLITNYRLLRDMPTGSFASGFAIVLYEPAQPGQTVRVRYSGPFTTFTDLTTTVEAAAGVPATAIDIPPLGAAVALMAGREVKRNEITSQPEPRRLGEVPAGSVQASWRGLAQLRLSRISAEAARLRQQYPNRKGS